MDHKKARRDESRGMEKYERHERKVRRDESRGMKKAMDKHNRHPRDHYKVDDKHLESQKYNCERKSGIDRVLQRGKGQVGPSAKMHAGGNEKDWLEGRHSGDSLTPRRG